MKIRYLLSITVLTLLAGVTFAGLVQPAPVVVDLVNMFAQGDQNSARTAADEVSFIGCGVRVTDDGVNPPFAFGFCQAGDSEENQITCFTQNPNLLNAMAAGNDFSFITFNWQDGGFGGTECTRVGYSTQSFYLPNITTKGSN
jgi:hypothetical protein